MFVQIAGAVALLICFANLSQAEDEEKWVWNGANDKDKEKESETEQQHDGLNRAINPNSRYEVFESEQQYNRPPAGIYQDEGFHNRPFVNRPGAPPVDGFLINERPYNNYPQRPEHGVLTGPVPSWLRDPPFRRFDSCKCSERFNCNSPGFAYGQCDVGKQYCCYVHKGNSLGGSIPHRPSYSYDNGILAGPGGPNNRPYRPNRPYSDYYEQDRPILRPQRPYPVEIEHTPELGVLVGPGGPSPSHRPPPHYSYGYDRQAKAEKTD